MEALLTGFSAQPWFAIAGEIVLFANAITAAIPNKYSDKWGFWKYVVMVFDWLSLNVFANKNTRD